MSDSESPGADQAPPFNWRDYLKVHPAADEYPLLRDSDPARFLAVLQDIRAHGMHMGLTFWVDDDGNVLLLDGRNRLDILNELGVLGIDPKYEDDEDDEDHLAFVKAFDGTAWVPLKEYQYRTVDRWSEKVHGDPYARAASYNTHRRHLEPEQYRARIEASHARIDAALKLDPYKSDRAHAEEQGVNDKTIAKRRKSTADPSAVEGKRIGRDGKARKPPAKRTKAAISGKTYPGAEPKDTPIETDAAEELQQQVDDRTVEEIFGSVEASDAAMHTFDALQEVAVDVDGEDPRAVAAWARMDWNELAQFRADLDRIIGFAAAVKAALDEEPPPSGPGGEPEKKAEEPADTTSEPAENAVAVPSSAAPTIDRSLDIPACLLRTQPADAPVPLTPPSPAPATPPSPSTWPRVRTTYVFQSPDDPSWRKFSDAELEAHKRSAERYCKRFPHPSEGLERARKHIEDVQEHLEMRRRVKCTVAAGTAVVS